MKKVLGALIVLLFVAGFGFATGQAEAGGSITLMQNKPEIDAMLQEYGAIWSENTGIDITIKSIGGGSGASMGQ